MNEPKTPVASRRNLDAVNVFRVESAQPYGWIVYLDGFAKTHFFASRSLALTYAREWAKVNAPSRVVVVGPDGQVDIDRTYTSTAPQNA
jgi:hypothetical protein